MNSNIRYQPYCSCGWVGNGLYESKERAYDRNARHTMRDPEQRFAPHYTGVRKIVSSAPASVDRCFYCGFRIPDEEKYVHPVGDSMSMQTMCGRCLDENHPPKSIATINTTNTEGNTEMNNETNNEIIRLTSTIEHLNSIIEDCRHRDNEVKETIQTLFEKLLQDNDLDEYKSEYTSLVNLGFLDELTKTVELEVVYTVRVSGEVQVPYDMDVDEYVHGDMIDLSISVDGSLTNENGGCLDHDIADYDVERWDVSNGF